MPTSVPVLPCTLGQSADEACSAEQVQQRETVEQLYRAIHQLPKADAALVLLYLDDQAHRDIAGLLGISESNVATKLHRLKRRLRARLEEHP